MSDNRVLLYGQNGPGLNRNFAYNSSSNNNNNSNSNSDRTVERRRDMIRLERDADNFIHRLFGGGNNNVRRRLFNDNNAPPSPGRKPKAVNVSKYEKMLKNLENKNKNKNAKNNKPNNENKNVVSWLNSSMADAKKNKIPKNKRVFLLTDMTNNGKIKQVWDRRFLNGLIESAETLPVSRRREVRENNDPFFTSPLTRKKFSKNDIKAYPPTDATKKMINRIMNLEPKVNKIMKIKNKDYLARSNILDTIKSGIRKGDITTEKQIKDLALIYEVTGREMLISGHKKDGDYYTAYIKIKFKPHHMKFMKNASSIVSILYDTAGGLLPRTPARAIVPLYKLPEMATKYLSEFEKYFEQPLNMRPNNSNSKKENQRKILQQRRVIRRVLRRIVFTGHINHDRNSVMKDINGLTNVNLRNKLGEYYDWYELVRNASS